MWKAERLFERRNVASVIASGAGPPLAMLYLMPKSPSGPPGLWLADRMMPPAAFRLRMRFEAAGVDRMPDHDAAEAVRRRHADGEADDLAVEEAAVAADHQRRAGLALGDVEDRLDEVLGVMRLLEMGHLLAQARCSRLLVVERRRRDGLFHASPPMRSR